MRHQRDHHRCIRRTSGNGPSPPPATSLEWRCIGPYRGGRVVAVAGDPVDAAVFYFGACAGGVWKTTDGGTYWQNISDGYLHTAAVGAIAVADSDPNVIYVGMGECCIRGDVSHGDGVYRSTDAGQTWTHLGLEDTRHIARIRIHPHNPDLVYVAALGHAYGPNNQRGVFRSSRRRQDLGPHPVSQRQRRRHRPVAGPAQSHASCTPPSGKPDVRPGASAVAAPTAACTNPPMAARPGRS